jgi:thiol-disulfide isomerase/thioredoxin
MRVLRYALAIGVVALAALTAVNLPRGRAGAEKAAAAEPEDPPVIDLAAYNQLIAGYRGKAAMVNFWATWCEPCRKEYPMIMSLSKEFGPQGLAVIGVTLDADSDVNSVRQFLAQHHPDFPNFREKTGIDSDAFYQGVNPIWRGTMPQTDFYARDGHLARYLVGDHPREAFVQAIRLVLAVPVGRNDSRSAHSFAAGN